jgi:hypothetical protein
VALSEFVSFVGFMPLSDIEELFTSIPTLARFTNGRVTKFDNETLIEIVRCIFSASDKQIGQV